LNTFKTTLRVACDVIHLAPYKHVVGTTKTPAAKITRALFYAMCRKHGHPAAPLTLADIVETLGRERSAASNLKMLVSGEAGKAVAALAVKWHDALDGKSIQHDARLVMAAALEVCPETAKKMTDARSNSWFVNAGSDAEARRLEEIVRRANRGESVSANDVAFLLGCTLSNVR